MSSSSVSSFYWTSPQFGSRGVVSDPGAPPERLLGLWVPDSARLQRYDLRHLRRGSQAWDCTEIQQQHTRAEERGGERLNYYYWHERELVRVLDLVVLFTLLSVYSRSALSAVHLARVFSLGRGACGRLLADHGEWGYRAGNVPLRHSYHPGGRLHHRSLHSSADEEFRCY